MSRAGQRRGVVLTRAGRLTAVSTVALLAIGWYLGLRELLLLGGIGVVLLVCSALRTGVVRPRTTVRRTLEPAYVHAGGVSRVQLEITNTTSRPGTSAVLHDAVEGTAGATISVGRLAPGATATATYRLPTRSRGRYLVGPLTSSVADPFGLTERARLTVAPAALVVFPAVTPLAPLLRTGGHDAPEGLGRPRRLGHGEEFHGLRPYVPGDDLRSVHWPTSARLDDLVVRQHSQERRGNVTVLVDLRRHVHDAASTEAAVSAAASVVVMLESSGEAYRLCSTGGARTDLGAGPRHLRTCLELLAVAGADLATSLHAAAAGLHLDDSSLVAITAGDTAAACAAVDALPVTSAVVVILRPRGEPVVRSRRPGVVPLPVPDGHTFAGVWNEALRREGAALR